MNERSQMAFSAIKQAKNHRRQKKDLRFAENRVDKITRMLVTQTAIVKARQANRASATDDRPRACSGDAQGCRSFFHSDRAREWRAGEHWPRASTAVRCGPR